MFAISRRAARLRALRLVAAAAVAAALTGCGGGGDPGAAQSPASTPESLPTKEAYTGELDALCASRGGGGKNITVPIGKAGVDLNAALASGADTDAIMDRIGRLHGRLADRRDESLQLMRDVDAPEDGGATKFFDQFARTTVLVRKLAATAPKMDGSWERWLNGFNKQAQTITRAAATSRTAARAYGIKRCETRPPRKA